MVLPTISPVAESLSLALVNGKTIAGCENVKGIKITNVIIAISKNIIILLIFTMKNPLNIKTVIQPRR